jgi:hypothetical protein
MYEVRLWVQGDWSPDLRRALRHAALVFCVEDDWTAVPEDREWVPPDALAAVDALLVGRRGYRGYGSSVHPQAHQFVFEDRAAAEAFAEITRLYVAQWGAGVQVHALPDG